MKAQYVSASSLRTKHTHTFYTGYIFSDFFYFGVLFSLKIDVIRQLFGGAEL